MSAGRHGRGVEGRLSRHSERSGSKAVQVGNPDPARSCTGARPTPNGERRGPVVSECHPSIGLGIETAVEALMAMCKSDTLDTLRECTIERWNGRGELYR